MTRLVFNSTTDDTRYFHQEDIERIVSIFKERGYELSENDARLAWEAFSDTFCAGWMTLPEHDIRVFDDVMGYLRQD